MDHYLVSRLLIVLDLGGVAARASTSIKSLRPRFEIRTSPGPCWQINVINMPPYVTGHTL